MQDDDANQKRPAARERGRPAFQGVGSSEGGVEDAPARWEPYYFFMFGHSHPFAQSLQQSHLQSQLGQSLQQSFAQHAPLLQQGAASDVVDVELELLAIPAATKPAATSKPPNNLTNI